MRAQPVTWPVLSGAIPPLGDFSPRPETGLGQSGTLEPGTTTVLTSPDEPDPGGHPLGGTGKTLLAASAARAVSEAGTADLVAWIGASSRTGILAGYLQALDDIGAAEPDEDPDAAAARFLTWLATSGRPWLVVLDDLADPADLAGLWPGGPLGQVLVTTRRHDFDQGGAQRRVRTVGPFSRREALSYLSRALR